MKPRLGTLEVLRVFAVLGMTSFGGPIAHLGYFRQEFVVRRGWLDERHFADLVALCQFLPGPASSQVGFAIGLTRAGYWGGLAAWIGFTLPSALLLILFAYGAAPIAGSPGGAGLLHGLQLVAVAVVAQAVWAMARSFCPDRNRASVAALAVCVVLLAPASLGQPAALVLGAVAGLIWPGAATISPQTVSLPRPAPVTRRVGVAALGVFLTVLAGSLLLRHRGGELAAPATFFCSGALVFGGGHVVLPLLWKAVVLPGWIPQGVFLAGYGAAQAVPGPLFAVAAFLGAVLPGPHGGLPGAATALVAIFLPGLLLVAAALPFWDRLRAHPRAQAVLRGVNAAVVGVLGAALYGPLWTGAVRQPADMAAALVGFVLLVAWRAPPLLVVMLGAFWGWAGSLPG